jgi:predicted nucleotidyltransferase
MSEVIVRRLDRDAVLARLREWARDELEPRPEVRSAVLIGSLASDRWSARSDADVVVVVADSGQPFRDRSSAYLPATGIGVPLDLFVYTDAERAAWGTRFRGAVETGVDLLA